MPKSISKRIDDAFENDSPAEAKEYLEKLSNSWQNTSTMLSRQTVLMLLVIVVFELLVYQHTAGSITIGSITIANSSIVLISLPTVVAYLIYEEVRLTTRWMDLENAHGTLYRKFFQKQYENDLEILLQPTLPGIWRIGTAPSGTNATRSDRFIFVVNVIVSTTITILFSLAFEVQAYLVLYTKFGPRDVFLWFNIAVSFGLLATSAAYYLIYASEPY